MILHLINEPFSLDELSEFLQNYHDTAVGPDQIHYQILKHHPKSSKECLLQVFNILWKRGQFQFPVSWTHATVITIPMPGMDKTDPNNYRSIYLTGCVCKTIEWMINKRLVWFLESNNILSNIQCGFGKNRSTIDHLVRLETCIRDALVNKEHAVSIYF